MLFSFTRWQCLFLFRNEGQFTALNDCLYRTMYSFPYTAFVVSARDIDEHIFNSVNFRMRSSSVVSKPWGYAVIIIALYFLGSG
jgi:hypothetical protein